MSHHDHNVNINAGPHHFNAGGNSTFHPDPHNDVHVGGNVANNNGHWGGSVQGGWTNHPNDHSSVGVNGSVNTQGGYNVGVQGSFSW